MIEPMKQPKTRAEFERRLNLLKVQILRGKFRFPREMGLKFGNVRFLPNGRIDFLSVDEATRLNANMMCQIPPMINEKVCPEGQPIPEETVAENPEEDSME